jgi:hypothetical protein
VCLQVDFWFTSRPNERRCHAIPAAASRAMGTVLPRENVAARGGGTTHVDVAEQGLGTARGLAASQNPTTLVGASDPPGRAVGPV